MKKVIVAKRNAKNQNSGEISYQSKRNAIYKGKEPKNFAISIENEGKDLNGDEKMNEEQVNNVEKNNIISEPHQEQKAEIIKEEVILNSEEKKGDFDIDIIEPADNHKQVEEQILSPNFHSLSPIAEAESVKDGISPKEEEKNIANNNEENLFSPFQLNSDPRILQNLAEDDDNSPVKIVNCSREQIKKPTGFARSMPNFQSNNFSPQINHEFNLRNTINNPYYEAEVMCSRCNKMVNAADVGTLLRK